MNNIEFDCQLCGEIPCYIVVENYIDDGETEEMDYKIFFHPKPSLYIPMQSEMVEYWKMWIEEEIRQHEIDWAKENKSMVRAK